MERTSGTARWLLVFMYVLSTIVEANTSAKCVLGGFESQVREVLRHVRMSPAHLMDLSRAVRDLERVLQAPWPGSKVVQFGATTTGLALKTSDVDCFVFIPHRSDIHENDTVLMSQMESVLIKHPHLFTNVHFKPNVDVPVLNFEYAPIKTLVDLTVTTPLMMRDGAVLHQILHLDEKILEMAVIVKYWSHVHGIAGSVYILPSYIAPLLVIYYLQQKNILPPIVDGQKNAKPLMVEHWNTGFDLSNQHIVINETLYDLLGGFFKFYSDFNFERVISPFCGCVLKREQIENLDLPKMFSLYEKNLQLGYAEPFVFGPVNVQDIFELNVNAGRPWNNRTMLDRLIFHTNAAAKTFDHVSSDKFLLTILEAEYKYKDLLNKLWSEEKDVYETCIEK